MFVFVLINNKKEQEPRPQGRVHYLYVVYREIENSLNF